MHLVFSTPRCRTPSSCGIFTISEGIFYWRKWIRLSEGRRSASALWQNKPKQTSAENLSRLEFWNSSWCKCGASEWVSHSARCQSWARPWIHLRWWGGGLMRDENPPRRCISGERVFFSLSLSRYIWDLGSTSNWFLLLPALHAAEKSVHCCIVSIGTYGEEFRLLPRHIKTRKRIRRRNYTLCSGSINKMRINICCPWRINQIAERRVLHGFMWRRCCTQDAPPGHDGLHLLIA